jgi:hypothetical protein
MGIGLLAALAALSFDFFGLYQHSGIQTILAEEQSRAKEVVNTFNVVARREIGANRGEFEISRRDGLKEARDYYDTQVMLSQRRVASVENIYEDEVQGVPTDITTGRIGRGDVARRRAAELRRAKQADGIDQSRLRSQYEGERDKVTDEFDEKLRHLGLAESLLNQLVDYQVATPTERQIQTSSLSTNVSVIEQIVESDTFDSLESVARRGNGLMSQAALEYKTATGATLNVRDIEVQNGNLFEMSIRGLMSLDIAAFVSLFLAFLFEWLDVVLVFMMRVGEPENLSPRREEDDGSDPSSDGADPDGFANEDPETPFSPGAITTLASDVPIRPHLSNG